MLNILFQESLPYYIRFMLFVAVSAALIFSLVMHELGHGYVALWNGDRTAKYNNRLSFNPLRHLDPIGFIMLITVGFGFAKPVPINPNNFKKYRTGLFTVSIAGVTVNIILAFLGCGLYIVVSRYTSGIFWKAFFYYLPMFNLFLFFFNLLPLYPLDGFRIVESLTSPRNRFTNFMRKYSMYILIVLVALGIIVDRIPVNAAWWKYVDVLGSYLSWFAGKVFDGFSWFWGLVFR